MKLFYTNASAKEEIGKLETENSDLKSTVQTHEATIKDRDEKITKLESDLSAMTTERDEAAKALEDSEASLVTANTALTTANEKLATFDAEVEKAASARFAGLGGNPLPESGKENESVSKKTMAEFNAMTPAARMAYVKGGGKLTE